MPVIDPGRTYEVDISTVTDGDTVDVTFDDGDREECRLIGVDTPETSSNSRFERPAEWIGIDDTDRLTAAGEAATTFARDRLADARVTLSFDLSEPARDEFGRSLTYLEYDDGTLFNRELLAAGRARVYHSGVTKHDEFRAVVREARRSDTGLWADSDPGATPPVRDAPVEMLFIPDAASVRGADGPLTDDRVPVHAEPTAEQTATAPDIVEYEQPPLVGVDRTSQVALVGGLLIDETYEAAEGFGVDTSGYGNFPFLTLFSSASLALQGGVTRSPRPLSPRRQQNRGSTETLSTVLDYSMYA